MTSFQTWRRTFQQQRMPAWDELPDLELYMDQVISKVNQYLDPILQTQITKTMINSYVKKELVERPVKKRYTRNQLAELLMISFYKTVFSLDEIQKMLTRMTAHQPLEAAYSHWIELVNAELSALDKPTELPSETPSLQMSQQIAIRTVLYKLVSTALIQVDPQSN
ncbi:DUF1836 domain-containing protein [Lactobacillus selangorensis]|nr:DUF1836 domain-containing protein [Lactobacillus selangorensis]